jgi:hypothetical protein
MLKMLSKKNLFPFILLVYAVVASLITATDGGDFDVYLDASEKLIVRMNIYGPPFVKSLQYYYSAFFAWLLIPFCKSVFVTEFLWSLLSFFFLYRTFVIIRGDLNVSVLSARQYDVWVFLIAFLSLQFILYNVSLIQVTFFLLWAIFESMHQISGGRNILGGTLLGLAINIKLMPLLILPYLFYRGHFKAIFAAVLTFIALLFIPAISLGFDFNMFLLSEWWSVINPMNKEHLFETGIGTHSLVALLPVYLTKTIGEIPYKRNILNLNRQTVEVITNAVRLLFLVISLYYLQSGLFKKEVNKLKSFWEISYFVLLIPLLFPHQQKYDFILVAPMISYLVYYFIVAFKYPKSRGYYITLYTFGICMLLYSPLYGSDIIGTFLFDYTQHYRFLTFATILLVPVSLYCSPKRLLREGKPVVPKVYKHIPDQLGWRASPAWVNSFFDHFMWL